jgi:hypothetical protein
LVSFLDVSPYLENWLLNVRHCSLNPANISGHSREPNTPLILFYAVFFFSYLQVSQEKYEASIGVEGSSQLRWMPEHLHGCLKSVKFKGFSSAKSLVELTCYILKNAKSLDRSPYTGHHLWLALKSLLCTQTALQRRSNWN